MKKVNINYNPELTDAENAEANNVGIATIWRYKAKNGIKSTAKPSRRELTDAEKLLFWKSLERDFKLLINRLAYYLSNRYQHVACASHKEDIKLWAFIFTQKYWNREKITLKKYTKFAIYYAYKFIMVQLRGLEPIIMTEYQQETSDEITDKTTL